MLLPARVEAIVDDEAEVARHVHPSELTQKLPTGTVGSPKFRLRGDGKRAVVTVGTAYDPALFPRNAGALRARLHERVRAAHPDQEASGCELVHAPDDDFNAWFVKYQL